LIGHIFFELKRTSRAYLVLQLLVKVMRKSRAVKTAIIVTLVMMAIICFILGNGTEYEKFSVHSTGSGEEQVYAECTCYGSLFIEESYPPGYNCVGIKTCKEVNYTKKR
jgi:hypothetical protein